MNSKTAAALIAALLAAALRAAPGSADPSQDAVVGSVVQSQEWTIHRGKNESEEFSGDVRYRSGPNFLRSDWALYTHKTKTWSLKGRVRAKKTLSSGDIITATGDRAFYDGISDKGWLTGKNGVFFTREPADKTPPDHAAARRLDWQGQNEALLTGGVHSFGPRLETWSDQAQYFAQLHETVFSGGRPVARKIFGVWTAAVKADKIRAFDSPQGLSADGRVVGWFVLPKKKTGKTGGKK